MSTRSKESDDYATLYERARSGDPEALWKVHAGTLRLLRWSLPDGVIALPPWEVEEIREDAFLELVRRFNDLQIWPQAWRYVEKTAISRARRAMNRRRNVLLLEPKRASAMNRARTPGEALDFWEAVQKFRENKNGAQDSLLGLIVDCCRNGDRPTTKVLVERTGLSSRTIERRLASLRKSLGPWLSP